jgi:hypothetical protein
VRKSSPALSVPYELIAVPVLFARGLVARSLVWRGTRYEIGRHGEIRSASRSR